MTRTVIVIAKAPIAGRVKTRLCPPCSPEQAAHLAEAALVDTLVAVRGVRGARRVLALDGEPGSWLPSGFEVVRQRGDGLGQRLAHAFEDVGSGGLLIGMDTPQVTTAALEGAFHALRRAGAVLGPSPDGGWWAIGLHEARPAAFTGVPMSTSITHRAQHFRLRALGLHVTSLPAVRDVDDFDDAIAVAESAPGTRFAGVVRSITGSLERTATPASRAGP